MRSRWLARVAVTTAVIGATALAGAQAAQANSTVDINDGNVPTTAAKYTQECSANQGGGPYSDQDVWVFVLPGNYADSGDFVSVTAQFDTNGDGTADTTKVITTDGGGFLNGGPSTSKAYIALPAGWSLITASAVITGTADFFNLTHTCAASGTTPTPTPSSSPSSTPTTPSSSSSSSESATSSVPVTTSSTPSLPVTGAAVGGMVLTAVALIGAGAALLVLRRRRDLEEQAAAGAGDDI